MLRRTAAQIANRTATRWAVLYLVLATGWVFACRFAIDALPLAAEQRGPIELAIQLLLACLTALGVFVIMRRSMWRIVRHHQRIREQHRMVQRSEERWRHLMANLSEVAWFSSWDGQTIHYVSPASVKVYGRAPEEFMRQPQLWLELIHPDDRHLVDCASSELERAGWRSVEYRVLHTDGSWRWLRDRASVLHDERGEPIGVGGVAEDITEWRAAEAAREAQRNAEAANRAKSEFLSRMSHELRTPLNAVLGFAQLIESSAELLSERQRSNVAHIRSAGWHLLALINDVLDVSRIESGSLKVNIATHDVREAVAEALRLAESLALQFGVRLEGPDASGDVWSVRADQTRLRQVLINVLSNAIKYNRPGGRVALSLHADVRHVRIQVDDNGLGMTPEQLERLYQPFNRLGRERGGIEGTGIGLTLTRELVLLMGGRIEIESQSGCGTSVHILMPVDRSVAPRRSDARHSVPMPLPSPPATQAGPQAEPAGLVLYIEDNPVNMLVVEQLLARWPNVQLVQAEDGQSSIELAARLRPDLVLLDMRLPDLDGVEVMRRLRAEPRTAALRVVALSASAMPDEIVAAREAGVLEYWTKPLDFQRFLDDVARLLAPVRVTAGAGWRNTR